MCSAGQNWLTQQCRKEQGCLYGLLESQISWILSVETAHRHPWLQTSLVTPYPLALAILRPSFTIIAVLLKD